MLLAHKSQHTVAYFYFLLGHYVNRPVVIAMVAMRMVQAAVYNVINVVAMWHGFVAAIRAVYVICAVAITRTPSAAIATATRRTPTGFIGVAPIRVGGAHL